MDAAAEVQALGTWAVAVATSEAASTVGNGAWQVAVNSLLVENDQMSARGRHRSGVMHGTHAQT